MKASIFAFLATAAIIVSTSSAQATTYNFNMTYDGSAVSLDPGSDAPNGTVLNVGDTFNINLNATGPDFWHVNSDYSVFVPFSFQVNEYATRTSDISTNFSNNGSSVFAFNDVSISQQFIHVGADTWNLAAGLDFDQVSLSWTLLAIDTNGTSTINAGPQFFQGFGQVDAPFFNSPKITYSVSAVPLPAGLPLLMTALIGAAGVSSRRRKAKSAT
jgi:hypothetical protein